MRIIHFKNKNIKLLTKEQQESYENVQICIFVKKKLKKNI